MSDNVSQIRVTVEYVDEYGHVLSANRALLGVGDGDVHGAADRVAAWARTEVSTTAIDRSVAQPDQWSSDSDIVREIHRAIREVGEAFTKAGEEVSARVADFAAAVNANTQARRDDRDGGTR